MVRADLFSDSLAVRNVRFGTAQIFCPPDPSPPQAGEDSPEAERARYGVKIPFELIQEYAASWNFARNKAQPGGVFRAAS